jgi:hypothetical protein
MTASSNTTTNATASAGNIIKDNELDASSADIESASRRRLLLGTAVVATAAAAAGAAEAQVRARTPVGRPLVAGPEGWGNALEIRPQPVVFSFRPDRMVRVAPERLRDWEQLFADKIGLRPGGSVSMDQHETISGSGGVNGDWDDCDYA